MAPLPSPRSTTKALVLQQLPDLTEDFAKRAADTKGRFTGNPSRTYGDDDGGAGDDVRVE